MLRSVGRGVRRLVRVLARPVRADRGRGGPVIQPYRGYGSRHEVFLMGRVYRQPRAAIDSERGSVRRDLIDLSRRVIRRGLAGAEILACLEGHQQRVLTDSDGYFCVHLRLNPPLAEDQLWHKLHLQLLDSPAGGGAEAWGEVYVPPSSSRCVVISDIDDTVMYTGVANKIKMLWRLFSQPAESRVPFPGVAALHRALHEGRSGDEQNVLLYVSRGPWGIYEMLERFFGLHHIPIGPIIFLREWGIKLWRPFPRRSADHKLHLIRGMLTLYADLPFVLIGDSGQHDPEIYTRIVREHPGRVLAVYIRNVSRSPQRRSEIQTLAKQVVEAGSSLLLAADTFAMAEHAAEHRLIRPEALMEVLAERKRQQGEADVRPTRKIHRRTPEETVHAVTDGELESVLEETGEDGSPPNVAIEADGARGRVRLNPRRSR